MSGLAIVAAIIAIGLIGSLISAFAAYFPLTTISVILATLLVNDLLGPFF